MSSVTLSLRDADDLRTLLDLADRPRHDVKTTTDVPFGVVIPKELHERFLKYKSLSESPPPKVPGKKGSKK